MDKVRGYFFINIAAIGIILGAWWGGHINSWVDILGGVIGISLWNWVVYFASRMLEE